MCFVNEMVSEENLQKFKIRELRERFFGSPHKPFWTISRELDCFLLYLCRGIEEESSYWEFYFHWKEHGFYLRLKRTGEESQDGTWTIFYELLRMTDNIEKVIGLKGVRLSEEVKQFEPQIFNCLKKSLCKFGTTGLGSENPSNIYKFYF